MNKVTDKLLTIKEVSAWLKLSPITLYSYINQGSLKAIKFGRYYRIQQSDLQELIKRHEFHPKP